jgi:hypothetical protein
MKEIKRFESEDGKIFKTEIECNKHEKLIKNIKFIMSQLEPLPKESGCKFENGDGYIQQDKTMVNKAMIELVKLSKIKDPDYINKDFYKNPFAWRNGILGRIFSDSSDLFYHEWIRFMRMDEQYREWGQPYFAMNPNKGTNRKRN